MGVDPDEWIRTGGGRPARATRPGGDPACPRLTPEWIDRDTRGSFLGGAALASFQPACAAWPRGRVERGFFDPVRSDVATLLVSGRLDPATPPEWGEEVARDLTHRLHAVFPNAAHPNSGFTGLDRLVRAFIESGTVEGLDLSQAGKGELPPIVLPPR